MFTFISSEDAFICFSFIIHTYLLCYGPVDVVIKCVFIPYVKNPTYIACYENKSAIANVVIIVIIIISLLSL